MVFIFLILKKGILGLGFENKTTSGGSVSVLTNIFQLNVLPRKAFSIWLNRSRIIYFFIF